LISLYSTLSLLIGIITVKIKADQERDNKINKIPAELAFIMIITISNHQGADQDNVRAMPALSRNSIPLLVRACGSSQQRAVAAIDREIF
jgi:hypothetical protein